MQTFTTCLFYLISYNLNQILKISSPVVEQSSPVSRLEMKIAMFKLNKSIRRKKQKRRRRKISKSSFFSDGLTSFSFVLKPWYQPFRLLQILKIFADNIWCFFRNVTFYYYFSEPAKIVKPTSSKPSPKSVVITWEPLIGYAESIVVNVSNQVGQHVARYRCFHQKMIKY